MHGCIHNIVFSKFILKAEYFQTKRKSLIMRKLKENNKKTHLSFKNNKNTELKLLRIHSEYNFKWIFKL